MQVLFSSIFVSVITIDFITVMRNAQYFDTAETQTCLGLGFAAAHVFMIRKQK